MARIVRKGQKMWQVAAEIKRPPNNPYSRYGSDGDMARVHLALLVANFNVETPHSLHNPWAVHVWHQPYFVEVPTEEQLFNFPQLSTPADVSKEIGYVLDVPEQFLRFVEEKNTQDDVPDWVQAYRDYLELQNKFFGEIRYRNEIEFKQ